MINSLTLFRFPLSGHAVPTHAGEGSDYIFNILLMLIMLERKEQRMNFTIMLFPPTLEWAD